MTLFESSVVTASSILWSRPLDVSIGASFNHPFLESVNHTLTNRKLPFVALSCQAHHRASQSPSWTPLPTQLPWSAAQEAFTQNKRKKHYTKVPHFENTPRSFFHAFKNKTQLCGSHFSSIIRDRSFKWEAQQEVCRVLRARHKQLQNYHT